MPRLERLERLSSVTADSVDPMPVDFDDPASPWRILDETSSRVAALQANFGPGRVLTLRTKSTKRPEKKKKATSKTEFKWDANSHASWDAYTDRVKFLVTFTGPPTDRVLDVKVSKTGVDLVLTEDGSLDVAVREVPADQADRATGEPGPSYVLTVHGGDRPGIVSAVVGELARAGGNITDLTTRLSGELYLLIAEVALSMRSSHEEAEAAIDQRLPAPGEDE